MTKQLSPARVKAIRTNMLRARASAKAAADYWARQAELQVKWAALASKQEQPK